MLGMLISTIGVLATLTLYKSLMFVAVDAKSDALHDGQLVASLLAIQLNVQNAGFGLDSTNTHITIVESSSQKNLFWRYKVNNVVNCQGLKRYSANNNKKLVLEYIEAAQGCDEATQLETMVWSTTEKLAVFNNSVTELVDFNLLPQSCSPYGLDDSGNFYMLTLSGKTAAHVNGAQANGQTVDGTHLDLCLINIKNT